jgi:hypothetical protein
MRTLTSLSALGMLLVLTSVHETDAVPWGSSPAYHAATAAVAVPEATNNDVIETYCVRCHNDRRLSGNMSLEEFDADAAYDNPEIAEKMIRKLRAAMMPPAGASRPAGDTLVMLVEALEDVMDAAAVTNPMTGGRTFQRLNQTEYERSIHELLALDIDASRYLPLDTKSANFDNIADVQLLSPMLLDAYMNAASEIARLAVGDSNALPTTTTYTNAGYVSQWDRIEGAPFGTRGGISTMHTFPADAEYVFNMAFEHTTTGGFFGGTTKGEELEISIDGERVQLLEVDRWMSVADPNGANMRSRPIFVRAGPHQVTAAFLLQAEGPKEDLVSPHDWSLTDRQVGVSGYGVTALAHLKDLAIVGPHNATGVSETPARQRIFTCSPTSPAESRSCAEDIVTRLGTRAFRRPLSPEDVEGLMGFYDLGVGDDGFERGVRTALEAMLASPDFVFRFEEPSEVVVPGQRYRINDLALASRLSFFLWGTSPDDELIERAARQELSEPDEFERQVRRMLADSRSSALGSRFAAQWLRLDDLEKVHPDRLLFPDYHQQLADAMRQETELFFNGLVRDDRSVFDLYMADYTYINERLARHYGIEGVVGDRFRRVEYPDDKRRGLMGHGSILTLTSHANRTSPVLRGKWVMEVLLGTPPPPPPPGVPTLEETAGSEGARMLTTRERMANHRSSPQCNSCHRFMDPIGLALDNFDVTGRWRIRENGVLLDTRGELYDGTPITSPTALQEALMQRPLPLIRTFTENLLTYALGRRLEYFDQPTVRAIADDAASDGYKVSTFIMGVVQSDAFHMQQVAVADDQPAGGDK